MLFVAGLVRGLLLQPLRHTRHSLCCVRESNRGVMSWQLVDFVEHEVHFVAWGDVSTCRHRSGRGRLGRGHAEGPKGAACEHGMAMSYCMMSHVRPSEGRGS
jgi:hypothetical protein